MNKQESKYFNTASLFDEALVTLLTQKDIEYITVKEICEKAGFNRSTFYLHYDTINDLLNETLEHTVSRLQNYFPQATGDFISKICKEALKSYPYGGNCYIKHLFFAKKYWLK